MHLGLLFLKGSLPGAPECSDAAGYSEMAWASESAVDRDIEHQPDSQTEQVPKDSHKSTSLSWFHTRSTSCCVRYGANTLTFIR